MPPILASKLAVCGELDQSQRVSPALTLEEFFDGNNDEGSIGCNLLPHPGLAAFRQIFSSLRENPDVADIRFPVVEWGDDLDWPFTDKAFVVTKLQANEVRRRVASLSPDEVGELDCAEFKNFDGLVVPTGFHVVLIWWD